MKPAACPDCGRADFGIGVAQPLPGWYLFPWLCQVCGYIFPSNYASKAEAERFSKENGRLPRVAPRTIVVLDGVENDLHTQDAG